MTGPQMAKTRRHRQTTLSIVLDRVDCDREHVNEMLLYSTYLPPASGRRGASKRKNKKRGGFVVLQSNELSRKSRTTTGTWYTTTKTLLQLATLSI
jgi:hypothetical protein